MLPKDWIGCDGRVEEEEENGVGYEVGGSGMDMVLGL